MGLHKTVFPGIHSLLDNRSGCLNTFPIKEGHSKWGCAQKVCGGRGVCFHTVATCLSSWPCQGGFKFTVTFSEWPDEAPSRASGWPDGTWRRFPIPRLPWNMSSQGWELAKQHCFWGCRSSLGRAGPEVAAIALNVHGIVCRGHDEPSVEVRDSWDVRAWHPLTSLQVWEKLRPW